MLAPIFMSEEIILSGTEENLKPIITLLLGIHQLIEHRDIGDIVGMPIEEQVKGKALTTSLKIFWNPIKEPPFTIKNGIRLIRPYANIPDVNKTKLKWKEIKLLAGGSNGYMWGRFRCTANLSNGRQMAIYGSTPDEAESRLKALHSLSTAKIVTLSVTEEKKEGKRAVNESLYKEDTRVYPWYFTVVNSEKIAIESERERIEAKRSKGMLQPTLQGDFNRVSTRKIPLWTDDEPIKAKSMITEALKVRGTDIKD